MKQREKPNGIWGTILLPINNNQIDWIAFEEQIHILCDSKNLLSPYSSFFNSGIP